MKLFRCALVAGLVAVALVVPGAAHASGRPGLALGPSATAAPDTNLAAGKTMEASSSVFGFVAPNANDDNIGTYWESNGFPATLTTRLGANADVTAVVVRLNPDPVWGPRSQAVQVLGRALGTTAYSSLTARADYAFGGPNTVTIPVTGRVADLQLQFFANTGAPGGQVAEIQVLGSWAPGPDLPVRGAAVPYVSYEAEAARYQGTLVEADPLRTFGHTNFGTESSGRRSVRLTGTGQFVEITSVNQANAIVVRNSIPDAPGGGGQNATISLYADDQFVRKLTLSSRNSWLYGTSDDTESLSNTPSADARRLFDESHALLAQSYPPGTRFRLQRDAGDSASFHIIDLIELEQVAPAAAQPAGCVSITNYGAVPNDGADDSAAIQRAVTDDENGVIGCVWIPAGQWRQEKKILSPDPNRGQWNQKGIRNVVVRGAGMWHSQLYTDTEPQNATGGINHPHEGNVGFDIDDNTQISDLAVFGMTTNRADRGHAINGRLGKNTRISNLWIEHVNVGAWVGRDYSDTPAYWNPGDGIEFSGMRIRNTYADGINFSNGTRNSRVFNSSFRTTGDDSLAVWANPRVRDTAVDVASNNRFLNNTIQLPWRANGVAVYGGSGNTIENNLIADTMNYPGIMLATDHDPLPFSGTTLIANNGLHRAGGVFWNEDQEFGAITLFPASKDITGVTIRDTEIIDSTYDGIQFKTGGGTMPDVAITNVRIDRSTNGAGILAMAGARGNATLTAVTITNSADGNIVVQPGSQFVITGG
jgi:hypothetical protein